MDSDGLRPEEGLSTQAAEKDKAPSAGGAGATAVFGGLPPEPAKADADSGSGRSLPVVHSVVFKADSSRAEGTDQLMNILRSPSLNVETPPPATPSPVASSGGFTQLLRALNYDQAKEPAATEPAKRAETTAPPPAMPQVTSFQTQPAANAPGSFTQMFQALDATPPEPVKPPVSTGPVVPENKAAATEPDVQLSQPIASPGSFTQMFRALDASPAKDAVEEPNPATEVSESGSFTQMFAAVSAPPFEPAKVEPARAPGVAESAAPVPEPGSFTQMFRTLDAAPVPTRESEGAPPAAAPGSFTQMFRTLDAAPVEPAPVEPPVPSAAGPGEFTRMFQAVSSPSVEPVKQDAPPAAGGTQGAFTQILSTPLAAPEPLRQQPHPQPEEAAGSFTQMFRTLDAAPPPAPAVAPADNDASRTFSGQGQPQGAPAFVSFENSAPALERPAPQPIASAGGLTQLLRTLDQPAQATSRPAVPPAPLPPGGEQQPGSFTSVYGTLGGEAPAPAPVVPLALAPPPQAFPSIAGRDATQAFRIPQPGGAPQATPVEAGPSEFTRTLNASMLRESGLKGGGEAAVPPAAAAPAPTAAPAWAMPAAPKMPEAPKLPQAPKVPEVKLPAAPKVAAPGGMQQYLPLLMILIVFLLLAILVAVVFLMKR